MSEDNLLRLYISPVHQEPLLTLIAVFALSVKAVIPDNLQLLEN